MSNHLGVNGRELPYGTSNRTSSDPLRKFEVTVPELERLVKRSTGRTFFIRAGWFAHCISQDGVPAGNYRGYDITGHVEVPKRTALKFLKDAYSEGMRVRVYAKVVINSHCFFIGG